MGDFAYIIVENFNLNLKIVTKKDNQALLNIEDKNMAVLLPKYNVAEKAGNPFGVKHTAETRAAMKLNYSKERRETIGALNRGKKLSPATVELIRTAALNRAPMPEI